MIFLEILFWVAAGVLFFCYAGYGMLLTFINAFKNPRHPINQDSKDSLLPITMIIAAYNEATVIEEKIKNTLAIDYPAGLLTIIIVSDGSADYTNDIISKYTSVILLHQNERRGKMAAIKRAMQQVSTPVVVFSDANTILNKDCLKRIVAHYADPHVGGVAGEKKIAVSNDNSAVGQAEGFYWRYESFMKKQDAAFNTVVGAAGELFSIRTALFQYPDDDMILDDFIISIKVCLQGYKIAYEPGAFAVELPSASLNDEEKRKVRISAGAYQSIGYLGECLNVFKHPLLCFQYISRRLLRWVFCVPLLILVFALNLYLLQAIPQCQLYTIIFYLQSAFYLLAISGWLLVRAEKKAGIVLMPFYFVFMNYCLVKGFARYLQGSQSVLWEKSLRQVTE